MTHEEMAAKHGDLVNHEARIHPREHQAKHEDHVAYKAVEHHHIITNRMKDHGYINDGNLPQGSTFKQFGEDGHNHDGHTEHMANFHHHLRKVGHASHADEHWAK